jgi:hypothetical protein
VLRLGARVPSPRAPDVATQYSLITTITAEISTQTMMIACITRRKGDM